MVLIHLKLLEYLKIEKPVSLNLKGFECMGKSYNDLNNEKNKECSEQEGDLKSKDYERDENGRYPWDFGYGMKFGISEEEKKARERERIDNYNKSKNAPLKEIHYIRTEGEDGAYKIEAYIDDERCKGGKWIIGRYSVFPRKYQSRVTSRVRGGYRGFKPSHSDEPSWRKELETHWYISRIRKIRD